MSESEQNDSVDASVHDIVLLPCPFCRIREAYKVQVDGIGGKQDYQYVCDNCGARGPLESKLQGNELAWNYRLGDPCREGCKIKRVVEEFNDSLTSDY